DVVHELRVILPLPEMFWRFSHQLIYRAILALVDQQQPVDWVTVAHQVKLIDTGKVTADGIASFTDYLSEISHSVPSSFGWERYGAIGRDCWARRELLCATAEARAAALNESKQPADAIEILDKQIQRIEDARLQLEIVPLSDAATQAEENRNQLEEWR